MRIQKKNLAGEVTFEYEGRIIERGGHCIVIEAIFGLEPVRVVDAEFLRGDRFVEYYYSDRWYNIFEVHDRANDAIKGWYCNIAEPAKFEAECISFVDLALDLWVDADGKQTVLDQDEFEALAAPESARGHALHALRELQKIFESKKPPF